MSDPLKDHLGLEWDDMSMVDVPSWWDTEQCPNCNGHIYCCGCDTENMEWKDCVHE